MAEGLKLVAALAVICDLSAGSFVDGTILRDLILGTRHTQVYPGIAFGPMAATENAFAVASSTWPAIRDESFHLSQSRSGPRRADAEQVGPTRDRTSEWSLMCEMGWSSAQTGEMMTRWSSSATRCGWVG